MNTPRPALKYLVPLFLLPLFFLLHGVNENFGLIPPAAGGWLLGKYFLLAASLLGASLLLFRNLQKAALFTFFGQCIYFFFGAVHDHLKEAVPGSLFSSYSFLLPASALCLLAVWVYLFQSKAHGSRLIRFLTLLLGLFCGWEAGLLAYQAATGKDQANNLMGRTSLPPLHPLPNRHTSKPDIYFIVLDEYTSSACLRQEFNFDNSGLDSLLRANRFFISAASRSNYNVTPFSLASTLGLHYLRPGLERQQVSHREFLQAIATLKNAWLPQFLKQQGYAIKNYGCFDLEGTPSETLPYFYGKDREQIDNQTLASRIDRDIWWNFSTRNIFTGAFQVPHYYKKQKQYHLFRNKFNFESVVQEVKAESSQPKFVYTHLMLPHEPFYLDAAGREVPDKAVILQDQDTKEAYLKQVIFTNRLLQQLVPLVPKHAQRERVVIIQGDHGYRFFSGKDAKQKEFMNLNAYYFSDGDYSMLYEGISPANTFRVVLNKYFQQSLPLLKDSSTSIIFKE
ncbi:sulfatase-like hydrolase/transferase [Paraflavisolibacter sp. H34]|uniref:sulfatase-like hydrolase/transferase n=1 Tax=Huijunlia imazamoxiresistens TaxID=3127457 RepID=UPI003019B986